VKVLAKGFAETQVRDVVVNASMITANNVELKITGGVETVTVEAGAETIQTESGELSKTIPQVDVKDLPYSSLNPYQLAVTLPGVMTVAGRDDATNGTAFAVNGLRPRANNFLIDGFDNNDNGIMGQAFQPQNTEAVQVVTFLTNAYAAEFGRGERFRVEPHVPQWFQYPSRLCMGTVQGCQPECCVGRGPLGRTKESRSVRGKYFRVSTRWSGPQEQVVLLRYRAVGPLPRCSIRTHVERTDGGRHCYTASPR
jgi:hypothetical protein